MVTSVRKHIRRTRSGKVTIVNKHTRKTKKGSTLRKNQLSVLDRISKVVPVEVGGYMDFNKKGLEKTEMYIGEENEVEFPQSRDYEVDWHTHPRYGDPVIDHLNQFPSSGDIIDLLKKENKKVQSSVIFADGSVISMTKTDRYNRLRNKKGYNRVRNQVLRKLDKVIEDDYRPGRPISTVVPKVAKELSRIGIDYKYSRNTKNVQIPIKVYEPKKKNG